VRRSEAVRVRVSLAVFAAAALAGAVSPSALAAGRDPQVAGLQVALRAQGLYHGAIDAIAGPRTVAAVREFQRSHGLPVTGHAGPRTRRALGPLGRHLFGSRILRRGDFGWDVAVLQFLLVRHGIAVPVNAYFDGPTLAGVRRLQRRQRLAADGVVGPQTRTALRDGRRAPATQPVKRTESATPVRSLLDYWAAHYGVDVHLVRAVAWMESGYNNSLVSPAGARGIMQLLPSTWSYVESVLIGHRVRHDAAGNVRVGVAYLRHLLHDFHGNQRLALAGWYQGEGAVRQHGVYKVSRHFAADVIALEHRM
jgi:hypothetical protein